MPDWYLVNWTREIPNAKELKEQLPYRPYCTNDLKKGLVIRDRKLALRRKYIQMNPPHMRVFLTFDLDYDAGVNYLTGCKLAVEDIGLPVPMWCVFNPKNGHVHVIYVLNKPVYTTNMAHLKPLRYLAALEASLRGKLEADPMYVGLISKNPWHKYWKTYQSGRWAYGLDYLAEYCGIDREAVKKPLKKSREEVRSLGRNCWIFEEVRVWAYREIRNYWGNREGYGEWESAVKHRCLEENAKFDSPRGLSEVGGIARSISRWVWRRMTPEGFGAWQVKNINHRWNSQKALGLQMLSDGMSTLEVANELGVTRRTCQMWNSLLVPDREIILPEEYRGKEGRQKLTEEEGISLRTYYRRQREGEAHTVSLSESRPWEVLGISRAWYYELKKRGEI